MKTCKLSEKNRINKMINNILKRSMRTGDGMLSVKKFRSAVFVQFFSPKKLNS